MHSASVPKHLLLGELEHERDGEPDFMLQTVRKGQYVNGGECRYVYVYAVTHSCIDLLHTCFIVLRIKQSDSSALGRCFKFRFFDQNALQFVNTQCYC